MINSESLSHAEEREETGVGRIFEGISYVGRKVGTITIREWFRELPRALRLSSYREGLHRAVA
jgi:hypothetical protein